MIAACYVDEMGVPWHYCIPESWFEFHRANAPEIFGLHNEQDRKRALDAWIVYRWHWHNQNVRCN